MLDSQNNFLIPERQDTTARNSLIGEFCDSFKSTIASQANGVIQLLDKLPHVHIGEVQAPVSKAEFGSLHWLAQLTGQVTAMAVEFGVFRKVIGSVGIGNSTIAGSALRNATTGAFMGTVLTPTDESAGGNFLGDRFKNGVRDAFSFGMMGAISEGLMFKGAAREVGTLKTLMTNPWSNDFISGIAGGAIHTEANSLINGKGTANWNDIQQNAIEFALMGIGAHGLDVAGSKIADKLSQSDGNVKINRNYDPEYDHLTREQIIKKLNTFSAEIQSEIATTSANPRVLEVLGILNPRYARTNEVEIKSVTKSYYDWTYYTKLKVAKNPATPPETLHLLSIKGDHDIQLNVARNPSTKTDTLTSLAIDASNDILEAVAKHASTAHAVLEKLAHHQSTAIRSAVAGNESTPIKLLVKLADDYDSGVRRAVAGNIFTPGDVLRELAKGQPYLEQSGSGEVKIAVAGNISTPPDVLDDLADHTNPVNSVSVRIEVASNRSTAKKTRLTLSNDPNSKVRAALEATPDY